LKAIAARSYLIDIDDYIVAYAASKS
jgi:hypothetical protein